MVKSAFSNPYVKRAFLNFLENIWGCNIIMEKDKDYTRFNIGDCDFHFFKKELIAFKIGDELTIGENIWDKEVGKETEKLLKKINPSKEDRISHKEFIVKALKLGEFFLKNNIVPLMVEYEL